MRLLAQASTNASNFIADFCFKLEEDMRELEGYRKRELSGGEGGIRTLERRVAPTRFPVAPVRPLRHLSTAPQRRTFRHYTQPHLPCPPVRGIRRLESGQCHLAPSPAPLYNLRPLPLGGSHTDYGSGWVCECRGFVPGVSIEPQLFPLYRGSPGNPMVSAVRNWRGFAEWVAAKAGPFQPGPSV